MTRPPNPIHVLTGAALGVGAIWSVVLLLWADAPFAVTFDDAWYYFEIGRNIADGHGSTFDTINQTNGYHPLWMAVSATVHSFGVDGTAAARVMLLIQLAAWVGTLLIVTRVVGAAIEGWPRLADRPDRDLAARRATLTTAAALLLLGASPYVIKTTVNGLESGVVVLTQAAVLAVVWQRGGRVLEATVAPRLMLGALLGLAFLARTDVIVMVGCLGLWTLVEVRMRTGGLDRAALVGLAQVFGPAAVIITVWFMFSTAVFGQPLQVSGEVKRLDLTASSAVTLAVLVGIAGLVAARGLLRLDMTRARARLPRTATFFHRTAWFASFLLLLIAYYTQLSAQQWLWYFAPHVLYLVFFTVLVTADFCEGVVAEASPEKSARSAMLPVQAVMLGVLAFAVALQLKTFLDPSQRSIQIANRDAGLWVSANLSDDAVLASWDAGVVGYFTEQPVINLDGVVNSFEWLDALRSGTTAELLRQQDLGYTINHAPLGEDGEDVGIRSDVERLIDAEAAAGLTQVHREEFTYSGRIEGDTTSGSRPWAVFVYELPTS